MSDDAATLWMITDEKPPPYIDTMLAAMVKALTEGFRGNDEEIRQMLGGLVQAKHAVTEAQHAASMTIPDEVLHAEPEDLTPDQSAVLRRLGAPAAACHLIYVMLEAAIGDLAPGIGAHIEVMHVHGDAPPGYDPSPPDLSL